MEEEKIEMLAEQPQLPKNEKQVITAEQRDINKKQYKQDWYKRKMANRICSPSQRKLCGEVGCQPCKDRSFATHPRSKYWSDKNNIGPHQIHNTDSTKYIFKCDCGHEILKRPKDVTQTKGTWCPYCAKSGVSKMCEDANCILCLNRSFSSSPRLKNWDPENTANPRHIFTGATTVKYKFICDIGHKFDATPYSITTGRWCPNCMNKTESKMFEILKTHAADVHQHVYFDWCINDVTGRMLPFDFVMESIKLIVELDGPQHFNQVKGWGPIRETRRRDWLKMRAALANGYSVIRLLQDDVWRDKNDWYGIFMDNFQKYDVPELVFISGEGMYENFEDLLDKIPNEPNDEVDLEVIDDE